MRWGNWGRVAVLTNNCVCNRNSWNKNGNRHVLKRKVVWQYEVWSIRDMGNFSTGALEIRKEWIWYRNHSLLNPDLYNTYTSDSFQTPQMTEKIDCCKVEVYKNKESKRGDTCNKSLKVGKWTTGIDSANPRKLNPILVLGRAEM